MRCRCHQRCAQQGPAQTCAAGVFVATGYFPEMPHHREWHEESRRILLNQLFAQTYADGGTREQAPGYLVFVIQFYLAAGILARKLGRDFPREHWARIEKTMEFLSGFLEGGPLPMLGDADDGYVLDLGGGGNDPATVLAAGATLFDREDFAAPGTSGREWAYWLLGTAEAAEPFSPARPVVVLACRAFPDTGYYMLQAGAALTDDAVSVVFDCAELGFGLLAAHGHADALAFVLRVAGVDVLVDPGTYDYFMYPEWRRYLRGTRAHNTLTIDSQDQSVMTGPFMWGSRAHARLREWKPSPSGGMVAGEHNGYTRLDDPVTHRRRIELDADARTIRITDEVVARGRHNVELNLHFSEHCRVSGGGGAFHVEIGGRALSVSVDARLMAMVVPAGDRPDSGWVSRGYHRRTAAPLVAGRTTTDGSATFLTQIRY